jgi:hypothetical protein
MTNWIKSLGMGARGERFQDDWTRFQDGFFRTAITFSREPSLRNGDGVVYYGSGWGLVFAAGTVTSHPYRVDDAWTTEWPWVVNTALGHWREFIHDGVPLDSLNTGERDLRLIIKRRSHVRLSDAEFETAANLLPMT